LRLLQALLVSVLSCELLAGSYSLGVSNQTGTRKVAVKEAESPMGRFASEGSSCLRVDQYRVRSGNGLERRREWRVEVCQGCGGFFGLETGLLPVLGLEHLPVAGGRALALVVLGLLGVFGIACGGDEVAVGLVEDGEADLGGSAFGDWV